MSLESLFTRSWYGRCGWTYVFRPLQPLIRSHVRNKRQAFLDFPERSYRAPVPVVVVGNISVGGTGKSPMVVALCELLLAQGYRPGIVSRGHGVKVKAPTQVTPDSSALDVGDEPVMLARRTACPMVVFPKRDEAVKHLLATHDVNIIICDDGMQHYQLHRDIEVAMLDASRGLGNVKRTYRTAFKRGFCCQCDKQDDIASTTIASLCCAYGACIDNVGVSEW